MNSMAPPPVIYSSRVLAYAAVDDIPYQKRGRVLLVDGEPLEQAPRLAICAHLRRDWDIVLFCCDEEWNVLGIIGNSSIEELKAQAEKNYPGVAARWVDPGTTVEQALAYYDEQSGGEKCSFCGKRPFELESWIMGKYGFAIICRECVTKFYADFKDK